ncbi:MAG: tetratricopeptide repeat protein [Candidatus Buchananbacteria bacterium]|nr:tetratricopeptide repeat protein [Candidatus Buchananbacteria bacterium]
MKNKNRSIVYKENISRFIIEATLVFLLVFIGLIFESYTRGLIFIEKHINLELLLIIFVRSISVTFSFVFIYSILRNRFSFLSSLVYARFNSKTKDQKTNFKLSLLSDSFIILSSILITMPIRPIFQETFNESDVADFNYAFVRYDALFSVIVLIILVIPLLFLINKYKNGIEKVVEIILIILTVVVVGLINNSSNFDARAYETRASWIKQDWNQQNDNAKKALEDAETDEERAIAYYWLGISESRKGNIEKTKEYQLKAISLIPKYAAAHASLSYVYLVEKEYEKSLSHAKYCVEYEPNYAWCYVALGNYYWVLNQVDKAILNFKQATQLDPDNRELKEIYEDVIRHQ